MSQSSCQDDGPAQRPRTGEGALDRAAAAPALMDNSFRIPLPGFDTCISEPERRKHSSNYRNLTVGVTDNLDLQSQSGEASSSGQEEDDYASASLLEEWDRFRVEEKLQLVQPYGSDFPLASKERERQSSIGGLEQRLKPPKTPSGKNQRCSHINLSGSYHPHTYNSMTGQHLRMLCLCSILALPSVIETACPNADAGLQLQFDWSTMSFLLLFVMTNSHLQVWAPR